MSDNPACREYLPHLSPFVDGELSPPIRLQVERHVAACTDCAGRVADFRAESGLVRVGMEMLADDVDFSGFAQKVMARVTPHKLPLWERVGLIASETWRYQRAPVLGGLAVAALLAVVVPVGWNAQVASQAAPVHLAIRSVRVDSAAHVAPVVMTNDQTGDAIIWLVDHEDRPGVDDSSDDEEVMGTEPQGAPPARLPRDRPSGGEL